MDSCGFGTDWKIPVSSDELLGSTLPSVLFCDNLHTTLLSYSTLCHFSKLSLFSITDLRGYWYVILHRPSRVLHNHFLESTKTLCWIHAFCVPLDIRNCLILVSTQLFLKMWLEISTLSVSLLVRANFRDVYNDSRKVVNETGHIFHLSPFDEFRLKRSLFGYQYQNDVTVLFLSYSNYESYCHFSSFAGQSAIPKQNLRDRLALQKRQHYHPYFAGCGPTGQPSSWLNLSV